MPPPTSEAVTGSACPISVPTFCWRRPRRPEIGVPDQVPDELAVLHVDRPIDSEPVIGCANVGVGGRGVRAAGDDEARRVRRDLVEDEERQERQREDEQQSREDAPEQEAPSPLASRVECRAEAVADQREAEHGQEERDRRRELDERRRLGRGCSSGGCWG